MNYIYITIWFFVCLIAQVLVFNHLAVAGGVVLFYVYVLVKMPVELGRPMQILIGFLLGFLVDIFSNTPGMHSLTCTTIMWARIPILRLYVVEDDFKAGIPSHKTIGQSFYVRFCASIVLCHSVLLYLIEAFTCFNFIDMVLKIIISAVITSFGFIAVEEFRSRQRSDN